ncbi:hypothetical protein LTR12_016235 [Friedmanniomyces endolithicus]|nr:hypothetical protein LTR12_016235 [Friedmanniomyces endolithicus]
MSKHDNIKDEEGGPIGQLYEIHILDHLSQRVNIYSRVLDDNVPASQQSQRSVIPLVDFPSNVAAVELPASGVAQEPEEKLLPIFDHSDVFISAPMVPARSSMRPETTSPAIEMIQQRITQQPTQQQQPAKLSQDVPMMQSKYISIPIPQHQSL